MRKIAGKSEARAARALRAPLGRRDARRCPSRTKGGRLDYRTAYQRDRDRSSAPRAFRRLRQKAVAGILRPTKTTGRNRLTHTLEVAQVARTIGRALGAQRGSRRSDRAWRTISAASFGPRGRPSALDDLLSRRRDGRGGPGLDLGRLRRRLAGRARRRPPREALRAPGAEPHGRHARGDRQGGVTGGRRRRCRTDFAPGCRASFEAQVVASGGAPGDRPSRPRRRPPIGDGRSSRRSSASARSRSSRRSWAAATRSAAGAS